MEIYSHYVHMFPVNWKRRKRTKENGTATVTKLYLKSPKKLLVKDQSTSPTQLHTKNGKESQEGLLIPTANWMPGSNKQEATLRWEPSVKREENCHFLHKGENQHNKLKAKGHIIIYSNINKCHQLSNWSSLIRSMIHRRKTYAIKDFL